MKALASIALAILLTLAAAQCFAACSVKPCEVSGAAHCHHQKSSPNQEKTCASPLSLTAVSHDFAFSQTDTVVEDTPIVEASRPVTLPDNAHTRGPRTPRPLSLRI
jgi:hypothetical protein